MKRINCEVAKEKIKGNLDAVGNTVSNSKFMDIGRKLVKIKKR